MKVFLKQLNKRRLRSYIEDPGLFKEHTVLSKQFWPADTGIGKSSKLRAEWG
jgi:hypothetical protein